jgi:hypothetical protein
LNQKQCDRVKHIFRFIGYHPLSDEQFELIIHYGCQLITHGYLSDHQIKIIDNIFEQTAEKTRTNMLRLLK